MRVYPDACIVIDLVQGEPALHLAAAITSGCGELWTNDERLTRAADNRIRIINIDQLI